MQLEQAHLANALFDAHRDDPEFGHRLLADEAARAGLVACDRTVWRICSSNGWWSVFGKKRTRGGKKAGPPAHDDLVLRQFRADGPNRLWLWDITEHPTAEGKVYLCAIKDVFSNRIVGYSISDRMTSQIAVNALVSAVQRRREVSGCVVHSDRGSQFRSRKVARVLAHHDLVGSMGQVASAGDNAAMEKLLLAAAEERPEPAPLGHPPGPAHRDHHLDRKDLPPPPTPAATRPPDTHRVRDHHEHSGRTRRLRPAVTYSCSRPFGHNVVRMDARLRVHLDTWEARSPQSAWLTGLLRAAEADPIWPAVLAVLDAYARSGRFAYLDRLAQVTEPPQPPRPLWDEVEAAALSTRPNLHATVYATPPVPIPEFNAALVEINTAVAQSLVHWWFTVTRVGAFRAYGEQGRRFAVELEPQMALPTLPRHLLPT